MNEAIKIIGLQTRTRTRNRKESDVSSLCPVGRSLARAFPFLSFVSSVLRIQKATQRLKYRLMVFDFAHHAINIIS